MLGVGYLRHKRKCKISRSMGSVGEVLVYLPQLQTRITRSFRLESFPQETR